MSTLESLKFPLAAGLALCLLATPGIPGGQPEPGGHAAGESTAVLPEEESTTILEMRADGSVRATLPHTPAEQAPEPPIAAGEGFETRLRAMLVRAIRHMPREPLAEDNLAERHRPTGLVLLRVDPVAPFQSVTQVLQACGTQGIELWNLAFEVVRDGAWVRVETPLALDAPKEPAGGAPEVHIDVSVKQAGHKVQPASGEPWTGAGPYRFEGRAVMYAYQGGQQASGGSSALAGYVTEPGDLEMVLGMVQKALPEVSLEVAVGPEAVFGDVSPLLLAARELGIELRFEGASGE